MNSYKSSIICLMLLGPMLACGKQSSDETTATNNTSNSPTNNPTGTFENKDLVTVTGTLAIQSLGLVNKDVSHVVALNVETGETEVAEVESDGTFELGIGKEQPWVLNYIDDSKTGADMIVSSFASETLDTLNAADAATAIEMGEVDVSEAKADMNLEASELLAAIQMSETAAATVGAIDDVSLRYSNPDIDNNGKVDAVEGKSYMIDFHNRFVAKTAGGTSLNINDMKNAFYPDDVVFSYTGTGIFPQIPRDDLNNSAPATYKWSFSVDMPVASNGGNICNGLSTGSTVTAGTACELNYTSNVGSNDTRYFTFGMETSQLKAGDYKLEVGDKTYQWTNVAVSDFSAGQGFLALFIRIDVDSAEKMTGISYKWKKKTSKGYAMATAEEVKLIVKPASDENYGGYISLKYQGDESKGSLGVMIPINQAEGSVVFADEIDGDNNVVNVNGSVLTKEMVKAGLNFADFTTNPGISYDDKLGMRFFF